MATYNNVLITSSDWVDLNTLSGAPVGVAIEVQNLSEGQIILQESDIKPNITNNNGSLLFSVNYGLLSKAGITINSKTLWGKLLRTDYPCTVAVYS